MRDNDDEFVLKAPQDSIRHPLLTILRVGKGQVKLEKLICMLLTSF
jgi:hypothetical protein